MHWKCEQELVSYDKQPPGHTYSCECRSCRPLNNQDHLRNFCEWSEWMLMEGKVRTFPSSEVFAFKDWPEEREGGRTEERARE